MGKKKTAQGCLMAILIFIALIIGISSCGGNEEDVDYAKLDVENVTNMIHNTVGDETDEDKQRILNIEVKENNSVTLKLNADSTLDAQLILYDTNDILGEIKKFNNVNNVTVIWYSTMVDDKGNYSEDVSVNVGFEKEVLDTINFENFMINGYEKYASVYFVHPAWAF